MLNNIMYVLNSFSIAWLITMFSGVFLGIILNIKYKDTNFKIFAFITIIAISVFAFNYEPTEQTDLFRLYETIDTMRQTGGSFYNSNEIITNLLFTFVSKTDYNQLLPFIVSLIRYSIFFYLIYNFIRIDNINGLLLNLYIFFSFAYFPLIESISGVRYYFSITILNYALVTGFFFINKNIINKILYFIPLFVHTSSSMFLALRFLTVEKIYKFFKPFKYIILFWAVFYRLFANILLWIGLNFTITASRMLTFYIEEDRTISLRLTIARFVLVIIIYSMFLILKKSNNDEFNKNIQYYNYIELVIFFTIGSIFFDVFFQRSVFFIALICMPLFFNFFNNKLINIKIRNTYFLMITILSLGMYMNQIYGLLVGYF